MATAGFSSVSGGKRSLKRKRVVMTIEDKLKICKLVDAVLMSVKSWTEVEESTIRKSWNKLLPGLTDNADVSEHEETSLNEVMDKLHVPAEERSDWLTLDSNDPGYHEYTDEELVIHGNASEEKEENEEDNDELFTQNVSHAQACQALETVLAYVEQQPEVPMSTTILLNSLLIQTARKRVQNLKQSTVNDFFKNLNFFFQQFIMITHFCTCF